MIRWQQFDQVRDPRLLRLTLAFATACVVATLASAVACAATCDATVGSHTFLLSPLCMRLEIEDCGQESKVLQSGDIAAGERRAIEFCVRDRLLLTGLMETAVVIV